jgi:L-alanine-DL-glutamate epimerase-like enolase superfamily enzyme
VSDNDIIRAVSAATIRAPLPEVIRFGDWVMREREFVLTRALTASGVSGYAFSLTRDGPVAAAIGALVAHHYVGSSLSDPSSLYDRTWRSNLASLSNGIGLRALSLVDLAVWDAKARAAETSIENLLGGSGRPLPATAIIGYPPASTGPDEVREQVHALRGLGWRRFKIAITLPIETAYKRVLAAREAAGEDAWLGVDGAWVFRSVDQALAFLDSVKEAHLAWFEDAFPPGDASVVAQLRTQTDTPIAMGDEQGGSYYPGSLLDRGAVDVIRIDLTCMGGLSRARNLIDCCAQAGVSVAPHMYAHIHSRVFGALGMEVPIEWGVPWSGVDQYADSLTQPTIVNGNMNPLPESHGFGSLTNADWIRAQQLDDPHGIVRTLGSEHGTP